MHYVGGGNNEIIGEFIYVNGEWWSCEHQYNKPKLFNWKWVCVAGNWIEKD